MDLTDRESILDKANRWLGRALNLKESDEKFDLWMLLGEPRDEKLRTAYGKALNILHKMPVKKDFVTEREAGIFSREPATEMSQHPACQLTLSELLVKKQPFPQSGKSRSRGLN